MWNLTRRDLLCAFALTPAARMLRGQQQQPEPQAPSGPPGDATFSISVKVVNLFANVRDKHGRIIRDLNKDDFLLDEDGRAQTIRYFSRETDLPLTLGLLVDTSGSQRRVLPQERSASYRFLEEVLREDKDLAFLIHFDFEVELLQDLTSSRQKLEKALQGMDTPQLQRPQQQRPRQTGRYPYPGSGGGGSRGGGRRSGGTSLYDAVMLASDELMKKQSGRKALILLSDGVDNGSKLTLADAVESAQRADTLVYSILFEDPDAYGRGGGFGIGMGRQRGGRSRGPAMNRPDGKKVLERISAETGARFFEVSNKEPIDKVFDSIQEDLRHQYSIGYTPDRADDTHGYRRIHLATRQKGLIVQAREGYYPS